MTGLGLYSTISENAFGDAPGRGTDLLQVILTDPRMRDHADGLLSCVQCGICTSGCPAARFGDYSPRQIAYRARLGDGSLLEDDSVWLCFYCYTCQSRCPQGNSVAVINQIIRGLQVESGYGLRHVELFTAWAEQFYETGIGGWPRQLLDDIAEAWGERWWLLVEHLDDLREQLGVGSMHPSEQAVAELRVIMDGLGFRDRLRMPERGGRPAQASPPGGRPAQVSQAGKSPSTER